MHFLINFTVYVFCDIHDIMNMKLIIDLKATSNHVPTQFDLPNPNDHVLKFGIRIYSETADSQI